MKEEGEGEEEETGSATRRAKAAATLREKGGEGERKALGAETVQEILRPKGILDSFIQRRLQRPKRGISLSIFMKRLRSLFLSKKR